MNDRSIDRQSSMSQSQSPTYRPSGSSNSTGAGAGRRPDPIQIRNIPAPLPTPAPSTPPHSGMPMPKATPSEVVELVSRPPTPAPSPTSSSRFDTEDLDLQKGPGGMDVLVEKGKARASDGELVGPDLRNEASLADDGPDGLLLRFQKLNKDQRALFLAGLIGDLALEEASTITRRIEPRLRRDFLKELPLELALHCMSFIGDARTLGRSAQVSRYWNQLFSDEQTWKEIYDRHQGQSTTSFVPPADSSFLTYSAQFHTSQDNGTAGIIGDDRMPNLQTPPTRRRSSASALPQRSGSNGFTNAFGARPFAERKSSGSFKQQFKRAYLTESNWLHGGQVLANYISPADGPVTTLCMDDKYVIIGMANSWIHIFDIGSGRLKRNLQGHSQGVWALAVVSKNPIAASMYTSPPTQSSSSSEARSSSSMGMGTDEGTHGRRASMTPGSAAEFGLLPGLGIIGQPRRPSTATGYGHNKAPREARKMKSSDQCGAAMGWPGLRRDLVVSGGSDRALRVWDINTGVCLHKLQGHRSTLRCLKMLDGRPICVTGSRDATVKVWDIDAGRLLHDLRGHADAVRCIEVAGNQVVSGSYDCTCRLWDADTGECLQVLSGHMGQIYAVAFDGVRVVAGSQDTTIRVWSASTGQCVALLQGHTSLVGQLQLSDDILTTGGSDGRIIVFNLETMQCLERLCAHDNSVTCLQFDKRFILSGGNDGRAKVWDMQTGRFLRELTRSCESVWRVAFKEDRAVVLCQRAGGTALEIISFRPEDEKPAGGGRGSSDDGAGAVRGLQA